MLRERLLERIGRPNPAQLSLLQAPPGYGKTTLIMQWLASNSLTPIWLSLDSRDNDVLRFWRYVVGAIQRFDTGLVPKTQELLGESLEDDADTIVESLVNELLTGSSVITGPAPLMLVLDDYHVINHSRIHDSVSYFLDNLPPTLHVVIASRTQPPLFIERRKVRGLLVQLTSVDLAFIPEETALFLQQRLPGGVTQDSVFALHKRTEGWAAAIQLAVLSMQRNSSVINENSVFTQAVSDLDEEVIRYLFDEVISCLDQDLKNFVVNASMLTCFSPSLLDAIYGKSDSHDIIQILKDKNLFVQPLHGEEHWFRFHELFREALKPHFEAKPQQERFALHQRIALAFEAMDNKEEAIEHYVLAQEWDKAASMVEYISYGRVLGSEDSLSETLLRKLPEEQWQHRPKLLLIKAWSLFRSNDITPAESYLARIEELLNSGSVVMPEDERKQMFSHIAVYRTQLAHIAGDPQGARRLIADHEALIQSDHKDEDLGLQLGVVIDYFVRGDMGNIVKHGPAILGKAQRENNQFIALGLAQTLGMATYYAGDVNAAFECFSQFHQWIESVEMDEELAIGWSYICTLDMYREINQFDKVEECWQRLGDYASSTAMPGQKALTHITYANALISAGRYEEAKNLLSIAQQGFSDHLSFWSFISSPISVFSIKLALLEGREQEAMDWADKEQERLRSITFYRSEEERALLIRIDIMRGQYAAAQSLLSLILEDAQRSGRVISYVRGLVLQVRLCLAQGNQNLARSSLIQALEMGEKSGYCRIFLDDWDVVAPILTQLRGLSATLLSYRDELSRQSALEPGNIQNQEAQRESAKVCDSLTPREVEILWLIKQGLKNAEIADQLSISGNTAKVHVRNLYEKLGVKSRTQAVSKAEEIGVFTA